LFRSTTENTREPQILSSCVNYEHVVQDKGRNLDYIELNCKGAWAGAKSASSCET